MNRIVFILGKLVDGVIVSKQLVEGGNKLLPAAVGQQAMSFLKRFTHFYNIMIIIDLKKKN